MRSVWFGRRFRKSINSLSLFALLFCYVFAFYIGPLSVSLLIAVPLYITIYFSRTYRTAFLFVISTSLIRRVAKVWLFLVFLSFLYPILFSTLDYSFFRVIGAQGLHLVAALPVFAYLKEKRLTIKEVETMFVCIFVIQTIIQLIVVSNDYLGNLILSFNRYDPDKVAGIGSNIRGKALSAATTYHLTLAYGIAFIVYIKAILSEKVSLWNIIIGILLFVGIFFAGRSGFVGCLIGALGFLFYRETGGIRYKLRSVFKIIFLLAVSVITILLLIAVYSPDYYFFLEKNVFAYAFEFFYSFEESGEFETASTNDLLGMWDSDFDPMELLLGSGHYTGEDGSYYMHVDPGILRHLLFMGAMGYLVLVFYQLTLLPFWLMKKKAKYYSICIFIFILLLDFKGCTLGTNKFIFAITLLISFIELYLGETDNTSEDKNYKELCPLPQILS